MSAIDDGGAWRGWIGWLGQRLTGQPDERGAVDAAKPAARPTADLARNMPESVLLDVVISGMPDPVAVLDHEGRVIAFNAGAAALAPALRRGEPASIALRTPELVEAIRAANASGQPQRIEFSMRLPTPRFSEAFVAPVTLAGREAGRSSIVVVTVHDLTPIRRVEEMRADFVANVSHELRTPLAALTGFIDTLQGSARDDPAARERFLGIMQTQAWRMARLIDDLLSLSRIELRAHQRPDTPVDLVTIVRQVTDGLQVLARDRGVAIVVTTPPEPLIVLGDRDELIRLFENLVENGLKYGASGKRVEITLARAAAPDGKGEARVSVRDFGPGITSEHLPRLTERFYRVDVGESRAQGGTGLGLALVKHILNRHQGRLTIESKTGEGATFTARLPLLDHAAAELAHQTQ
jgi:two-component system, OmpR family, phosphate regulon sensor histidine kinase PhoR